MADELASVQGFNNQEDGSWTVDLLIDPDEDMYVRVMASAWCRPFTWLTAKQDGNVLCTTMYPPNKRTTIRTVAELKKGVVTEFKLIVQRPLPMLNYGVADLPDLTLFKHEF